MLRNGYYLRAFSMFRAQFRRVIARAQSGTGTQWGGYERCNIPLLLSELVIMFVVVLYDGQQDEACHDCDK